jgi:hypothetical protein
MAALWKRLSPAASLLILLALHATPSFATEDIVFGPGDFKISWLRLHLSFHTFPVDVPGEGTLIISKKTPDKGIEGGFLFFNNHFVSLQEFLQGEDERTEREVSLRSANSLLVFLRGAPGATISMEVIQAAAVSPPQVTLQAKPQSITFGEASTLEWTTFHAERVVIEPGIGEVPLNGSLIVSPTTTSLYVITATGPGGTATDSVEVEVLQRFEYESYGLEADEQEGGGGLVAGSVRILNGNAMEDRAQGITSP